MTVKGYEELWWLHFNTVYHKSCTVQFSVIMLQKIVTTVKKSVITHILLFSTTTPLVRKSSHSSPQRRPARQRNFVRSSSSPNTISDKSSKMKDNKSPVTSPPRSEAESLSPAAPTQGKLKRSVSDSHSRSISAVSRGSDSSSSLSPPTSAKRTGSQPLSPSPPTSAAVRKPGSASRFRKMVLDNRHGEQWC